MSPDPRDDHHPRSTSVLTRLLRARWVVRAPILLYRVRLGALLGSRILLLEHVGRTSGARRYAVLEVVDRPAPRQWAVVSGFGPRAQWFRNVTAQPRVRLGLGSHRPVPAVARVLEPEEARACLDRYASAHAAAWRRLAPVVARLAGDGFAPGEPLTTARAAEVLPVVVFEVGGIDADRGRPG